MSTQTLVENKAKAEEWYRAAFDLMDGHTLNGNSPVIQNIRREAIKSFEQLGFPTRKSEAWKYTPIEKVFDRKLRLRLADSDVTREDINPFLIDGLDAHVLVMVNGTFNETLSDAAIYQKGVVVSNLNQAAADNPEIMNRHFAKYSDYRNEVFAALNTAFNKGGLFIYVPEGLSVEKPFHVLSVYDSADQTLIQPRLLVIAERNSQVRLIESGHETRNSEIVINSVTEIFTGENSFVDHYKLQMEGSQSVQVNNLQVYQQSNSFLSTDTITLGGKMVRNSLNFLPDGENCETHLYGLYIGRGGMHIDNHTMVDHAKPNCRSDETYKGILADEATGVFNGKVLVRPDAQKTNAYQSNKSVVLSDTAHMYEKPELEIYADDVKCSHGATTGQLDSEAMFYLRSRGISESKALTMLLTAFARDVLEHIQIESLRSHLDNQITSIFQANEDS